MVFISELAFPSGILDRRFVTVWHKRFIRIIIPMALKETSPLIGYQGLSKHKFQVVSSASTRRLAACRVAMHIVKQPSTRKVRQQTDQSDVGLPGRHCRTGSGRAGGRC